MSAREHAVGICSSISLALAACLPFLVLFSDAARNIDLQGLLLIVSGGFAWAALLLGHRKVLGSSGRFVTILLIIFALSCLVSLLVNPHFGYDILGAPFIRLGTAGLLACVGIGLLARAAISPKRLLTGLYVLIAGVATVSVPYSWLRFHSLLRIGGVFAQADIMACFLGCGFILGLGVIKLYPRRQKLLLFVQAFLAAILLLTETRAVLLLVAVLSVLWVIQNQDDKSLKPFVYIAVVLLLFGSVAFFMPSRVTNTSYANQSVRYRLTLQSQALRASQHRPLWGYGPGNLADALDCRRLSGQQLQATCRQGYFFNSSHNIFLDRILAIGWLGGISYLTIVILAIYRGWRGKKEIRIFTYALALIAGYYLTNVTSVTLELLLWVLLLPCLFSRASTSR